MANVDTGLGWSADSGWLLSDAGIVVELGIFKFLSQQTLEIPKVSNIASNDVIVSEGLLIQQSSYSGYNYSVYIGANSNGGIVFTTNPSQVTFCRVLSYGRTMTCRVVVVRNNSIYRNYPFSVNYYQSAANVYTGSPSGTGTYIGTDPINYIPQYSSTDDALADVSWSSSTYYKLNRGSAVGACVKWMQPGGVAAWTPILISSDREAVRLSIDGQTEFSGAHTYLSRYNGIAFYMSYYQVPDASPAASYVNTVDIGSVIATLEQVFRGIAGPSYANILVTETVDPYDPFGNTEEGGGEPDPNPQDDDIEEEDLPTLSFSSAGFARIYRPSLQQINDLADYMWTDQTFLQTVINHLKQLLENPMDAVISLSLIPCVPPVGADVPVKVMFVNTGVSMPPVTNQFVQVDCGSFALKEMYGSALDYNPYTKVQLYLPYVGTVKLDTDEVMGKTLQVKYNIDVVTGVCCAYVIAGGDVLYQFSGHCSINQPISSADFSSYINAAIAAAKVSIATATGGAAAAAGAAASGASAPAPAVGGGSAAPELPPSTALVPAAPSGPYHVTPNYPGGSGIRIPNINFAELAKPGNINTVASAMGGKVDVMHSGGFGGNSGYLAAVRRPYLIVTRPRIANPQQYGQFNGRPSMMYLNLGSCTGYTQVQSVYLTGFDATNPELAEISELLKGGVVL